MANGKQHKELIIRFDGEQLEQIEVVYLGRLMITEDGQCTRDMKRRICLASATLEESHVFLYKKTKLKL